MSGPVASRVAPLSNALLGNRGQWQKAFVACRKHRIDLSTIVQHNQDAFMGGVSDFVDQIQDVDYVNLFLTSVGSVSLYSTPSISSPILYVGEANLNKRQLLTFATQYVVNSKTKTPANT